MMLLREYPFFSVQRESRRRELRAEGVVFQKKADISTFTLGALMVRRAEQEALRRHAMRLSVASRVPLPSGGGVKKNWLEAAASAPACVRESAQAACDRLLTRIALEAYGAGIDEGLPDDPALGILPVEGDPLVDILKYKEPIPLSYTSTITGDRRPFIEEPSGSVGLRWRKFLITFYGPFLVHPATKVGVFVCFGAFLVAAVIGCCRLESGLDLRDLSPVGGYLNQFDLMAEKFFGVYDFPVDVFFPEVMEWWSEDVQQEMRDLQVVMETSGSGKFVTNPFIRMLDDVELRPALQSGDQATFERALYDALSLEGGKYKQFEQNFLWEGSSLRAWKLQILPGAMKTSAERAAWMKKIRKDCEEQLKRPVPMVVMAWNYMMTFYESDLQIRSSVISNMVLAAATMLLVAMVAIPHIVAGLIVCLIMGMIDVGILGFMYYWSVKLNMVSLICLLISVGFSVDFTAHLCHTFMDAEGHTRDQRAVECLVVMGNPVFHGAASSILGVLMLGFSSSYIFRVFFKMMIMVMVFALVHSVIFLPVLLSIVGSKKPHKKILPPPSKESKKLVWGEVTQRSTTVSSYTPLSAPSVRHARSSTDTRAPRAASAHFVSVAKCSDGGASRQCAVPEGGRRERRRLSSFSSSSSRMISSAKKRSAKITPKRGRAVIPRGGDPPVTELASPLRTWQSPAVHRKTRPESDNC